MVQRFDGLAERYHRYRPGYPTAAVAAIAAVCREVEAEAPLLLDVGAGTGIGTRALAEALGPGWRLVGIEPSDDMRRTAVAQSAASKNISFQSGAAEALPFDDNSVGAMLVAQALHWFDRPVFYKQAGRLLVSGGGLFVLFNDRDPQARLFQDFEALMEREVAGYSRDYRQFDYAGELGGLSWCVGVESHEFRWNWRLPLSGFSGLMLSRSMAKPWIEAAGEAVVGRELEAFAAAFADGDQIELPYITRLVMARKRRRES